MKKLTIISIAIFLLAFKPNTALADYFVADSSAQLVQNQVAKEPDFRTIQLEKTLEGYGSPISEYAKVFVKYSDEYELDWRFVASISGVESTFGKRIPFNSYNAYGWANGEYSFQSWEESIGVVSKALGEKYIGRGAIAINQIARIYAPPSSTWANNVRFFMRKINPLPVTFTI